MIWRKLMTWLRKFWTRLPNLPKTGKGSSLRQTSKSVEIQLKLRVTPGDSHALVSVLDLNGQWCSALVYVEDWGGGFNILMKSTDFKPKVPAIFGTMESMMLKFSDSTESPPE